MAAKPSVAEVKDGFTTSAPDTEIQALIDLYDAADACMDAAGYSDSKAILLKTYAVRHHLSMVAHEGKGQIVSHTSPAGGQQTYQPRPSQGRGLGQTAWGLSIRVIDTSGCVSKVTHDDTSCFAMSLDASRPGLRCET